MYTCACTNANICVYTYVCIHTHVHTLIPTCMHTPIHRYACIYTSKHTHTHAHTHTCTYIHLYTHIHTHTLNRSPQLHFILQHFGELFFTQFSWVIGTVCVCVCSICVIVTYIAVCSQKRHFHWSFPEGCMTCVDMAHSGNSRLLPQPLIYHRIAGTKQPWLCPLSCPF
jgi:hypothetical protein